MLEISYLEVYKLNLLNTFTIEQNQLLNEAGIYIQDKNYSKDEIKIIFNSIIENVMNKSLKNRDMTNSLQKYNDIINILDNNIN